MDGVELTGPLAQVQATNATKEDTLRLIRQLIPDAKQARWERGADAWWNALQEDLDVSHMPLTYCLAPLHSALDALGPNLVSRRVAEDARRLLDEVCDLGRRREELRNYPEPSRLRVEAERVLRLLSAKRRAVAPPSSSARPPRTRSALR